MRIRKYYILLAMLFLYSVPFVFADEDVSKEEIAQPSIQDETTKDKAVVTSEAIEKAAPSYSMRLKDIIQQAQEGIKRIDKELAEEEIRVRNQEREAKVKEFFDKGNALHKEGDLKGAKEAWQNALNITKDPEMRSYIDQADKKARQEDQAKRQAKEKARQEELSKKEAERKAKLEAERKAEEQQDRLEAEKREQARLQREAQRQADEKAREQARLEREAQRKQEAEQRERKRAEEKAKKESERQARIEADKKVREEAKAKEEAKQESK
ncbi:MAG: hypothetical protein Q8R38_03760 [Candidatus Omnitrophota bacterium]|nr:hypothetical protein [Candidatus Omnitrophota bacterium]